MIDYNFTVKVKYYRMMLTKLSGIGLSKTVMERTKEWLRVKLEQTGSETTKLTDVAKRFFLSCARSLQLTRSRMELGNDGMRNAIQTTEKALQLGMWLLQMVFFIFLKEKEGGNLISRTLDQGLCVEMRLRKL